MENSMNAAPAMATMNSTNPTLVRYSSVRLQAAGEERPNLTGEERPNVPRARRPSAPTPAPPAAGANVSGGGGSSSVFTRALHAAQARKMHQRKQLPGSAVSNSKKTSGIKGKKVVQEKIYTRCTPAILSDLFSGFGDQQKELVKQMGFDGLLSVRLTKLNKQFGAWILCKLDPSSGNLFAGSRHEICLTCEDVSLLLGIPCGRKEILLAIKYEVKYVKAYMCEIFEKDSFDGLTIVTIQRILEKKFNMTMTVHEQIIFKTAFIIFVVTKFLAPQSVNNHISIRYMKALVDVENIHKYNWAEFWTPATAAAGGGVDLTQQDDFFNVMRTPLRARATPRPRAPA
uniref:Aminotransferase-like plant mobile domain-containing protein n=1 Tax=Oryza glumipatula TaxID=40148 RepID=A0A0D9ZGN8_9ORYZ